MHKYIIPLFLIFTSCVGNKQNTQVIYLSNNSVKIGILPDVGGRMVFYGEPKGNNLLYSNSKLWDELESDRIKPSPNAGFKAYNGFITWVGPQSDWWSQQDLLPLKKGELWPPDPYTIYDNYTVKNLTDTSIVLLGNTSPVTGLQMSKQYLLDGNKLIIKVIAENKRNTAVKWDLWSNIRFDAFTKFKIPTDSAGLLNVELQDKSYSEQITYSIEDGYFSFQPSMPNDSLKRRISKAYIHPLEGEIIVYKENIQLKIEFEKVSIDQIHPNQALVEVYNSIDYKGETNILELEHHSAYKELKPADKIEQEETWTLKLE